MEILIAVLSWVARVTYFYMSGWWGIIVFAAITLVVYGVKNLNYDDDNWRLDKWRYTVPRSILDASIWPLWIFNGFFYQDLAEKCEDNMDSVLVGGTITLDVLGWTFIRSGDVNLGLAIIVGIIAMIIWRILLATRLQIQDPNKALTLIPEEARN